MCFSQEMSGLFSLLGLSISAYLWLKINNIKLAIGVFWFFLMEFLQFWQYMWINDCQSKVNQVLTLLGFIHICYQPYFCHLINASLSMNPRILEQYKIVHRLCILGGTMLLSRYLLYGMIDGWQSPISSDYTDWSQTQPDKGACRTYEWLRGEILCTYKGNYHLAWSVPMIDPTYYIPSAAIHSFLMFAPFFLMKWNMVIQGIFLYLTGPFLARYITPNLQEQASIWCFFSIAQIGIMLFIIREQLVSIWGKDKKKKTLIGKEQNGHSNENKNEHTNGHSKSNEKDKTKQN